MGHPYFDIAFTDSVRAEQEIQGSRAGYAKHEARDTPERATLGADEAQFIAARDSFYMASVSETGWPYVQHRGGPIGFVRAFETRSALGAAAPLETTAASGGAESGGAEKNGAATSYLAFADFAGNRQYVSQGNLRADDRVSLFFMNYGARRRLKLYGHARAIERDHGPAAEALLDATRVPGYRARIERAVLIRVAAFDWNCPQHITPRYSIDELAAYAAARNDAQAWSPAPP